MTIGAEDHQKELGESLLEESLIHARSLFGGRLVAAYALGSLAHGGFSAHVSDVDLGLVLADPLRDSDAAAIGQLCSAVAASGLPLADRLSVFWGSRRTLAGEAAGGRFPPLDCLDLKQNGRLLLGDDVRAGVAAPGTRELVLAAARMALNNMSTPEVIAQLREPAALVESGVRPFTKRVLFPVRFVYTARTGRVGTNHDAAHYFAENVDGAAALLAQKAYGWRNAPYVEGDAEVVETARQGLLPLYRLFVEDYATRLDEYGEAELASAMREGRARLS